MTNSHSYSPRLSAYAAKVKARQEEPAPAAFNPLPLEQAEELMQPLDSHWKKRFSVGSILSIEGLRFRVVAITRRGLVVHRVAGIPD